MRPHHGLALVLVLAAAACRRDCPPSPGAAPPGAPIDAAAAANPVQHEMQRLHAALQATVTGVAYGDVRAVPAAFAQVDQARHATEAAIESGAYRPARNGDQLARFAELDEAFHGRLEALVEAAARNDVPATAEALGPVLRACQPCHGQFRR